VKTIYGILLVGVSAIALGGCTTGGTSPFANALLGSATVNADGAYQVSSASDAATDKRTTGKLEVNYGEGEGVVTDATLVATVTNGDQVKGPTTYAYSDLNPDGTPTDPRVDPYAAFYRFDPTQSPQHPETGADNSILFAGAGQYSYAALVGGNDPAKGEAAAANTAGFFAGTAPTALPTGKVSYAGTAVAGMASGEGTVYGNGTSKLDADFAAGTVEGDLAFDEVNGGIGFNGTMSTSHATYSAASGVAGQALTLYTVVDDTKYTSSAFGQVVGGFFGPGAAETAGTFSVQDHAGAIGAELDPSNVKIIGSFGGKQVD
jgi:hypothetical protein